MNRKTDNQLRSKERCRHAKANAKNMERRATAPGRFTSENQTRNEQCANTEENSERGKRKYMFVTIQTSGFSFATNRLSHLGVEFLAQALDQRRDFGRDAFTIHVRHRQIDLCNAALRRERAERERNRVGRRFGKLASHRDASRKQRKASCN